LEIILRIENDDEISQTNGLSLSRPDTRKTKNDQL